MLTVFDLSETSPSAAGVAFGTLIAKGLDAFSWVTLEMVLTGATGGTLNVGIWTSDDSGTTWDEWHRSADISAAAAAVVKVASCTPGDGTPVTIGRWTSSTIVPALTKGTTRPGLFGTWAKVVFEAGASTSAGAAQKIFLKGYRPSG